MPIYPSLEDLKGSELIKAQLDAMTPVAQPGQHQNAYPNIDPHNGGHGGQYYSGGGSPSAPPRTMARGGGHYGGDGHTAGPLSLAYPSLRDFMGLELTEEMIRINMPEYLDNQGTTIARPSYPSTVMVSGTNAAGTGIIAPISGTNQALMKSMVTHGVRHCTIVVTKKGGSGKIGLRVRSMNTGVFICLVTDGSPAAEAGLRFGDQILQIDGVDSAGMSVKEVHKIFQKKSDDGQKILLAIRDRPFERSVTLVRDSAGHIGFQFKNGQIINIVKDSSAARNGLLTEHALLEINGKNVIGLKDKEITAIINSLDGNALNVTVMPAFLYNHMIKEMNTSLLNRMDHSNMDL